MSDTPRVVGLPPDRPVLPDGALFGGWWHDTDDDRIVCDLCPRECHLKPGDRGFCFVRQNRDGEMVLTTYGRSTGFCIDPIEKKPLNHFLPGTSVLSFGTAGCNLGCKFCQNHDISKARKVELLSEEAAPDVIARVAQERGCSSVAYTYNDPIIWAEYAIDTAKACRAYGLKSVAVTAGYITPEARGPFFEFFDAANVDLKAFTEDFYQGLTLSHLQPVLDTIAWLKRETDVWFEVTNLVIPDANDSPSELRQLCDWLLEHVGDEVPLHFSAFHPDFRLLDRPRTPHETLLAAYEIARDRGLKYVYVGNVHDVHHQSTYCGNCGKLVIERDWYQLGAYHLERDQCKYCHTPIPGQFAAAPGNWGRRREPIQIQPLPRQQVANPSHSQPPHHASAATMTTAANSGDVAMNPLQIGSGLMAGALPADQQQTVHRLASEFVAAAVTGSAPRIDADAMTDFLQSPVMGVYVSLKRSGRLRGCCGFSGRPMPLWEGLKFSSNRTAKEDIRMPPVSPSELPFLDLEVWLLQGLLPVTVPAEARADAIQVGRDGLLISRGEQRGLLLPGVATDNGFDEETFLRQVCVKAKLPPTAWKDPSTQLQRFEGTAVAGPLADEVLQRTNRQATSCLDDESFQQLTEFCRENVAHLLRGAVPNYYAPDAPDGMLNGAILSAYGDGNLFVHAPKISLRPQIPLQATLYQLSENLARFLRQSPWQPERSRIHLTLLEDPAMHGTTEEPDLRGLDTGSRAMLLLAGSASAWRYDPGHTAEQLLRRLHNAIGLRSDQLASVFSFRVRASEVPVEAVNRPLARKTGEVRPPAVAGSFYPQEPAELQKMVKSLVSDQTSPRRRPWRAAMLPHAGLRFSGRIAAQVLSHIEIPDTVIVIGPKHTRQGVDWAVAPHARWSLPGFEMSSDPTLAAQLAEAIEHLELDSVAHHTEHAIEVELPLLHHFAPRTKVVGIAMGGGDLQSCQAFAEGLSTVLQQRKDRVLLLISSDMNHFASDAENRRLDEVALQAMETLNPATLLETVREHQISMCGVIPAVTIMQTLQRLQPLSSAQRVAYATSADVTQDTSRVVGYAGMLLD